MEIHTRRQVLGTNTSRGDSKKKAQKYARVNRTRNMIGDSTCGTLEGTIGV